MKNTYYAAGATGLLAPLQDFLADEHISEILINRPQEVFIERNNQMLRFDLPVLTTQYLRRLFTLIANENHQSLSSPILSGNLSSGERVQLVIPNAAQHETLAIRNFALKEIAFSDFFTHVKIKPQDPSIILKQL